MKAENQHTLEKAFREGINLFLGAGFSVLAKDKSGNPLPVGQTLKTELINEFKLEGMNSLDLPSLCTVIKSEQEGRLSNFLRKRFAVDTYDKRYNILSKVSIKSIFTTNIDDLIYNIYGKISTHYINDITHRGASFGDKTAINYTPLHGSVLNLQDDLVFCIYRLGNCFLIRSG
jgi:hypothetical protein